MNRSLLFDSPFLLGFEHTRLLVERAAKAADSYPPYNVEETGDARVRITIAVAGFTPEQLQVTVEDNQLIIAGRKDAETRSSENGVAEERAFLHRGIAARGFLRTFVLADRMEVEQALLEHGLLHIDLVQLQPARLVKRITIKTAS
jgi:HSP20 family molecular chaperone IbpA